MAEGALLAVRYWTSDRGHLMDPLFRTKWLERMVRHGYAVIVVERSGTGASFGVANLSHEAGAKEADANPELDRGAKLVQRPHRHVRRILSGHGPVRRGLHGNPHLKAIFPASSGFDTYGVTYSGGVYNKAFQSFFTWAMAFLERVITPVDGDTDGALLAEVLKERRGRTVAEQSVSFRDYPFRDSATPKGLQIWKGAAAIYPFVDRINRAKVPAYMTVGWYDIFPGDAFLLYNNLTVPKRLTVRPIDHSEADEGGADLDYAAEAHRWFDIWLKGIDNGIMNEPPIHYYAMGAQSRRPGERPTVGRSRTPRTGRCSSAQARAARWARRTGALKPGAKRHRGRLHSADPSTSRVEVAAINWKVEYPDMRANDAKALTFTSEPLASDVEAVGHPVVHSG